MPDKNNLICVPNFIPISDSCENGILDSITKACICKEGFIGKYCDILQPITKNEGKIVINFRRRVFENYS